MIPDIDGDTIHVNSIVDFVRGSALKDIWSENSCTTRETKKATPLRGPVGV